MRESSGVMRASGCDSCVMRGSSGVTFGVTRDALTFDALTRDSSSGVALALAPRPSFFDIQSDARLPTAIC